VVQHHFDNNPVYRNLLAEHGVEPEQIRTLDDLRRLPITDSTLLTSHQDDIYTDGEDVVTYLHTSGSTGTSKILPVSRDEKATLARNDALTALVLGLSKGPIYCTYPCGPWPSAYFAQHGGELLAATIRADMGLPVSWHVPVLKRFKPRVIMASPAYITYFAREIQERGLVPSTLGVELIKLAGEPLGTHLRCKLAELFQCAVMDLYGSAELGASAAECPTLADTGLSHYLGTEILYEVHRIGSQGELCHPGERGELVVTALFRRSVPIIRYNTKDIVYLEEPSRRCECGLGLPLASRVLGRSDEMFTYGGANVYPEMVYASLSENGVDDKFQLALVRENDGLQDQLVLRVEQASHRPGDATGLAKRIEQSLRRHSAELDYVFGHGLVASLRVELRNVGELYRVTGKLKRFVDEREHTDPSAGRRPECARSGTMLSVRGEVPDGRHAATTFSPNQVKSRCS